PTRWRSGRTPSRGRWGRRGRARWPWRPGGAWRGSTTGTAWWDASPAACWSSWGCRRERRAVRGMTNQRGSYRKTILAVTLLAIFGLGGEGAVGWLLLRGRVGWVVPAIASVALALAVGLCGLVVAGGFIALQRDRWEAQGIPYAPKGRREWLPGPLGGAVRGALRLLGSAVNRSPARLALRPGESIEVKA